ncbi:MAG TPA: hypothetical protein DCG19_01285 [Cryomorphaceae bacterium]|nr:hypothetical protein [Owenweeksia sp.]MBF99946.1 hypothetical protein [Owenweeksia sp.]HAD96002.1 hypothetical protein [Cryomorphaceae bacterium]HBF20232.1 hypothetical protein [Cryomorphaceae bacterium]|tara:strand:- start:1137 stop:1634 length:498 start_codon:yes stop_codon:yes gene_type:complete
MKKVFSLSLFTLVFLSACEKEIFTEGTTGPQGIPGEPGNANVRSGTYEVSEWNYQYPHYMANIDVSFITDEIFSSGVILVYVKRTEDSYTQLPLTFYWTDWYSTTLEVITRVGQVTIEWTDSDLTEPVEPGSYTFKIVAIESSELLKQSGVDPSDYEGLSREFQL